jgi:hypothetical protein
VVLAREGRDIVGFFLITLGLMWLASNLGWLNFVHWSRMWPVTLVLISIWFIVSRNRESRD